jgi:glycosyltransferase involved in cell wall biosynthesis
LSETSRGRDDGGLLPEVSVVIPCYNGERFVTDAIESVLDQTRGPVEIIVVDDGSSDGSVALVERYAAAGQVVYIRHDTNKGIAAARNTGVRVARGRYIGFLDQDDLWCKEKTARLLPVFEDDPNQEIGVVFSRVERRSMDSGAVDNRRVTVPENVGRLGPDELISRLFLDDFVAIVSTLIRRECFDRVGFLDESIRSGSDDFEFLVRIAQSNRFVFVDETLAVRRLHTGSYTDAEKMIPDALAILERTVSARPALAGIAVKARARFLYMLARDLHLKKEYALAKQSYLKALRVRPWYLKPLTGLLLCSSGKLGDALLSALRSTTNRR